MQIQLRIRTYRWSTCLLATGVLLAVDARAIEPGDLAPPTVQEHVTRLSRELEAAMAAGDESEIRRIVEAVRKTLGDFAGIPESPERYHRPIDTSTPEPESILTKWSEVHERLLARAGTRNPLALENKIEMREAAYVAIVYAAAAQAGLGHEAEMISRAREELDYLVERQDSSGLFPYPTEPGGSAPEHVRKQVEALQRQHPERVRNGLLYLDRPDMQFDVGCAAVALCEGYRLTGDEKYLQAARRAGNWAQRIPLSANWNYNAFSVWLLSSLHRITEEQVYLDAAVQKCKLGVLPGLMENGRWVDQHNAKQSYHFIMVRALSDLSLSIPSDHPDAPTIDGALRLAVESRSQDILRDGVSNTESALWGLSLVGDQHGLNEPGQDALNAVVNAVLDQPTGFAAAFLPLYTRYRTRLDDSV